MSLIQLLHFDDLDECEKHFTLSANMIYRGQPHDLPLLPSIARADDGYPQVYTPEWFGVVKKREEWSLNEYSRLTASTKGMPKKAYDFIPFAQHHRVKTRYLDWTQTFLIAVFFAVDHPKPTQPVIWCLESEDADFMADMPTIDDLKSIRRTRLLRPNHVSPNIRAQRGLFSVMGIGEKGRPFEKVSHFNERLTKITLTGSPSWIRRQLDLRNVNASTVYPDLENLGRQISTDAMLRFPPPINLTCNASITIEASATATVSDPPKKRKRVRLTREDVAEMTAGMKIIKIPKNRTLKDGTVLR